jgi:hypothetical protein
MMLRLSLLFLLLNTLLVGLWAQFIPYSFYQYFPNSTWSWVSIDGPYNQHLVRDVGGLNLALTGLIVLALFNSEVILLRAVAISTLIYQIPHTFYHIIHLQLLPTTIQQATQTFLLVLGILASLVILFHSRTAK